MQGGKTALREGMNRVQKTAVRVLLWVLTLGMCVLIFGFSAQDGDTSMETSGMIAEPIARVISTATGRTTPSGYEAVLMDVQAVVRKTAHFFEYALLGFLTARGFKLSKKTPWLAILACAIYASTDEFQQTIIPGRSGELKDVLLDTAGATFGVTLYWLFHRKKD